MGPYCFNCGQHAHESARSISALFHDAWHIVTHIDGRFWQIAVHLAVQAGKADEGILRGAAGALSAARAPVSGFERAVFCVRSCHTARKVRGAGRRGTDRDGAGQRTTRALPRSRAGSKKKSRAEIFDISDCNDVKSSIGWLQNALRQSCLRNQEDGGASVEHAFLANIPKMMFLLVPMMALVMLLLYWRPRRYYVEHLVFFLHNHAAIFLLLLIQALLGWIAAWLAWSTFGGWVDRDHHSL